MACFRGVYKNLPKILPDLGEQAAAVMWKKSSQKVKVVQAATIDKIHLLKDPASYSIIVFYTPEGTINKHNESQTIPLNLSQDDMFDPVDAPSPEEREDEYLSAEGELKQTGDEETTRKPSRTQKKLISKKDI